MAESMTLTDAILRMTEVMEDWKGWLGQIHERIQDIELAMQDNAIDPEEFRRLRLDVADIERRTREGQADG